MKVQRQWLINAWKLIVGLRGKEIVCREHGCDTVQVEHFEVFLISWGGCRTRKLDP